MPAEDASFCLIKNEGSLNSSVLFRPAYLKLKSNDLDEYIASSSSARTGSARGSIEAPIQLVAWSTFCSFVALSSSALRGSAVTGLWLSQTFTKNVTLFSLRAEPRASSAGAPCKNLPSKVICFPHSGQETTHSVTAPHTPMSPQPKSHCTFVGLLTTTVGAPLSQKYVTVPNCGCTLTPEPSNA